MKLILIRHAQTAGNMLGKYIGITDEGISEGGAERIRSREYPSAERIISSPMLRCTQTAGIIYPDMPIEIYPELRECDFGDFENKSYQELNGDPYYQAWIDSGGELPFPNGESRGDFCKRCQRGFARAVESCRGAKSAAFVIHGGTVMAIMDGFAKSALGYFSYQIANGGYIEADCVCENGKITIENEIIRFNDDSR